MGVQWGRRALTGLVGIPTALRLLASPLGMLLLASALCCLCQVEFSGSIAPRIVAAVRHDPSKDRGGDKQKQDNEARSATGAHNSLVHRGLLVVAGAVACVAAAGGRQEVSDLTMFAAFLVLTCFHLARAASASGHQAILVALLLDIFALCFIVSGFVHAILLRSAGGKFGLGLQILGLCCSWVCDTGALVMGSALGRAKLAPSISPGKTVVGAVAGVISSVATVLIMFALPRHVTALRFFLPPLEVVSFSAQIVLGLVLGVLCILGDLVESFVKRLAGVKDSGAFFPGHGGCLDRMDSFLFVAPCLYYYARYLW